MYWDYKLEHLKILTNRHQHTKIIENEKIHILNKRSYYNQKARLAKTEIPPSI